MTWFFAILIVLVMGVVAVVATGRGGSMAETFDDRPDSRVQADGPLTATDLRRVRFTTAFRGYRMSEVDALLDRLSEEIESRTDDPHG
jgi:DivIVA domain-containing protein